jgi:hypothetical protein
MTTGKTIAIVAGVGIGGLVLYELLKPGAPLRRPSTAPAVGVSGSIISGLASAAAGIFGSSRPPAGANAYGDAAAGQAATYAPSTVAANGGNLYYTPINGGGYSAGAAANYGYADTHPGAALPDGVYGPPVPVPQGSVTGSDDGLIAPTEF